jgi:hypothetical protein
VASNDSDRPVDRHKINHWQIRWSTRHMTARQPTSKRTALTGVKAQIDLAVSYVRKSKNMEVLRPALAVIQAQADPAQRPVLHEKYEWCEQAPEKHDSGGFVRASIVRALQPIIHYDDLPILQRALVSYQMVGLYEVAAELRTAALKALNDLEPDLATYYAARFLRDPLNSNSGEPALSSIRLLAAQQQLAPIFAVAAWPTGIREHADWPSGNSEITSEALRNLVDLPASLVPLLVEAYHKSEDEQILLGLYDLLLAHPARAQWRHVIEHFLQTTRMMDLYALVVTQIVVTRDGDLIAMLREMAAEETDRVRYELLRNALEHA